MKSVLLSFAALVAVCALGNGLECKSVSEDKCTCIGSNFTINFGAAFQSPSYQNITDNNPDGTSYSYTLSPCVDVDCGKSKARVCQYDPNTDSGTFIALGKASSETKWDVTSATEFTITFVGGDLDYKGTKRQTVFTGVVEDVTKPTYKVDGEEGTDPLSYKFSVTYSNKNSSVCTPSLSNAFRSPTFRNISDPVSETYFILSPCSDVICGYRMARACQHVSNANSVIIGTARNVTWESTDSNSYVIKFHGGDSTYNGKTRVTEVSVVVLDVVKPSYSYNGLKVTDKTVSYQFVVIINNETLSTYDDDSDLCNLIITNSMYLAFLLVVCSLTIVFVVISRKRSRAYVLLNGKQ